MKRLLSVMLVVFVLSGCRSSSDEIDRVVALRTALQNKGGCSFNANITVDYGDSFTAFALSCKCDDQQNMDVTVLGPDTISGITYRISGGKGKLTFDDTAVGFEMIADDQITPVCAPWLIMKALKSGYISATSNETDGLLVRLDDSFFGTAFSVDIWLGDNDLPKYAEVIWQGKRIVSMHISDFEIL